MENLMLNVKICWELRRFASFIWRNINFRLLSNNRDILLEEQQRYYLSHNKKDMRIHTFPKNKRKKLELS